MKTEHWIAIGAIVATVLVTWFGSALNERQRKRQERQKAHEALEAQADVFASAVIAVRIAGHANDRYWNGKASVARVTFLAVAQLLPGLLEPGSSVMSAFGSRADRAAALIAYMDGPRNRGAVEVTIAMKEAVSAAMPLARHEDVSVANATNGLLNGLINNADEASQARSMSAFRAAVRAAVTPPPSRWHRLVARRPAAMSEQP